MRWIVLGNPENRRVVLFQLALAELGLPPAHVVSWLEFLRDPAVLADLSDEPALFRIDSAGENFLVDKELLRWGGVDPTGLTFDRGLVLAPRQMHAGFVRALGTVREVVDAHPCWVVLDPPEAVVELFDKRITSRRWRDLGIPVPEPLDGVVDLPTLLDAADGRVCYLKMSMSSSASGLAVFFPRRRPYLMTTIEDHPSGRWYNTRRVRRISDEGRIAAVLERLLDEGVQIELSVPKARLGGAYFDLRIVVVAGEPVFEVIRCSPHPITNLHLGGRRGDPDALAAVLPADVRAAAMDSCRAVGAASGMSRIGVDLLYERGFTGHRIVEGNAFGDLLPGLRRDGLDVYGWQIRTAMERHVLRA